MNENTGITVAPYNWNNSLFSALINQLPTTLDDIAQKIGVSKSAVIKYCSGTAKPTLPALIKISDYFQVPIDILMCRYSEEDREQLLKGNAEYMLKCRTVAYERYMLERSKRSNKEKDDCEYVAVYPYNLLDMIYHEPFDTWLDEDHTIGLNMALSTLSAQEQKCLDLYFKEELTYDGVAARIGRTKERVRQIIARALRKLRHPSRWKIIHYGYIGSGLHDIAKMQEELDERMAKYEKKLVEYKEMIKEIPVAALVNTRDEIDSLDLSVRASNGLKRGNIDTIDKLIEQLESGEIWKIRNIGFKTIHEIVCKIETLNSIKLIEDDNGCFHVA